jgi:TRAP-type C4-dicarboxylate transport system permease large subunit
MLRHVAAVVLGLLVCFASVVVHRLLLAGFPAGLLLAVAATLATAWWLRTSSLPRSTVSYAAGWLLLFTLALQPRAEGDYALASDLEGYVLMGTALVVAVVALTALTGSSRAR